MQVALLVTLGVLVAVGVVLVANLIVLTLEDRRRDEELEQELENTRRLMYHQ